MQDKNNTRPTITGISNMKQLCTSIRTLNYCKPLCTSNIRQLCTSCARQLCTSCARQLCTSCMRELCTSCARQKVVPKNLKGRKKSSQDWLTRQLNDPYVKLRQVMHYRARSAFKLSEINERHKILRAGQVVVECGAAPGAWTQVAVQAINSLPNNNKQPQGLVVGVDLLAIHPLPGATLLGGQDFTFPVTQCAILDILKGKEIDVVLSDMAPNASGTKTLDHESIIELAYSALRFAVQNSAVGGTFLCKVWDGYKEEEFLGAVQRYYQVVKIVKPPASRGDSSEKFVLATQFIGLEKT